MYCVPADVVAASPRLQVQQAPLGRCLIPHAHEPGSVGEGHGERPGLDDDAVPDDWSVREMHVNVTQTYGFDGVDPDWEYLGAGDRGGVAADAVDYPVFLSELRAALVTRGISLQHPRRLWDSSNRFTGPSTRPHTSLTNIESNLELTWRAGVNPAQVTLGLGRYAWSFTLADPSCNVPNGIKGILASGTATESYDWEASVKRMRWNNDQWVSYDSGVTGTDLRGRPPPPSKLTMAGPRPVCRTSISGAQTDSSTLMSSPKWVTPHTLLKIRLCLDVGFYNRGIHRASTPAQATRSLRVRPPRPRARSGQSAKRLTSARFQLCRRPSELNATSCAAWPTPETRISGVFMRFQQRSDLSASIQPGVGFRRRPS
ncbi:hypothetical protein MAPG_01256 [Magnaporthiopsis poae ATCC 64411]|uniref:Chitinase n=1 Tax=Magnaporthiopsis poae (strain ATCC 64411 / 73-15) TaxID=644358 RepID=A0A0C4DN77_MAGP6|nr:hypothetical protein MAPG_01256 [Magnaporthiopsis poae ATCC 64411]